MAVGFETTAPSTASVLLKKPPSNFSVLCCHRMIPPALKAILDMGEIENRWFY
jgi:hydrogenase expression/formation protein HypD